MNINNGPRDFLYEKGVAHSDEATERAVPHSSAKLYSIFQLIAFILVWIQTVPHLHVLRMRHSLYFSQYKTFSFPSIA